MGKRIATSGSTDQRSVQLHLLDMSTNRDKADQAERIARLQTEIPRGTRIYTCIRHMSDTRMTKILSVHRIDQVSGHADPQLIDITYSVAMACGLSYTDTPKISGIRVKGTGFNPGEEIVTHLSMRLHGYPGSAGEAISMGQGMRSGSTLKHATI
jgi:hypothetical protein